MKINLKRGTEIKPTKTWHMTETNRSCFIWSWSRKATPATADMAKCSFPYIAHLIERKPDEASGKLNRRTKALLEYWNICMSCTTRKSAWVNTDNISKDSITQRHSWNVSKCYSTEYKFQAHIQKSVSKMLHPIFTQPLLHQTAWGTWKEGVQTNMLRFI